MFSSVVDGIKVFIKVITPMEHLEDMNQSKTSIKVANGFHTEVEL
jgi:hypothetical protein